MALLGLSVSKRIYVGFGILVAIAVGVGGFGLYQSDSLGEQTRRMTAVAGNVRRALEAARLVETVRRTETRFRLDMNPEAEALRAKSSTQAAALLEDAAKATLSDTRRQMYNAVRDQLRQHDADFNQYRQLTNAVKAARDKLFTGGDTLTANAGKLVAAAREAKNPAQSEAAAKVESAMLLVRVANWRFMATSDPKGPATFAANVKKAEAALDELEALADETTKPQIAPVREALEFYRGNFAAFSDSALKAATLFEATLLPQSDAMQARLAAAVDSLTTDFDAASAASDSLVARASTLQEAMAALALVLGVALAVLIGRGIARPVVGMTQAMKRLAAGDTAQEIPAKGRADEIGDMARAVEVFRQQALQNARMAADQAREQAAKERRQQAMDQHTKEFGDSVAGVMSGLMDAAAAMRRTATEVGESAQRTRASTSATVEGAEASARDLNAVAAATEEMASSIKEISSQVASVSASVQVAVDRAAATDTKVAGLSDTADRIGDVVRLISDIAGQTNLLALNATIEAARAGEAGRGFAVVAGEVKALAAQTAKATEQIGGQIEQIRGATREAVGAVREVGEAIGAVVSVATAIAAAVEQQSAATQEISNSVQTVTATTSAASGELRAVLSIAEQTDETSRAALAAAEEVGRTAGTLRAEVTEFLRSVTTAEGERRKYERVAADGMQATLRFEGRAPLTAPIVNISLGGIALAVAVDDAPGTPVEVGLPTGATVRGRVARREGGEVGIAFRQDEASLRDLERVLALVAERGRKAA